MSTENVDKTNKDTLSVQLLDDEGDITKKFEQCLSHIFAKYCTPSPTESAMGLRSTPKGAIMDEAALDQWAKDTNGEPFSKETKEELLEYIDMTDAGDLTFQGFLQIYALQTENDEEETYRDLAKHGFNRNLELTDSEK